MKNKINLFIMTVFLTTIVSGNVFCAFVINGQEYSLNGYELSAAGYMANGKEQKAYEYIIEVNSKWPGTIRSVALEYWISYDYMTDYIDEFKALGYLRADYGSPTTTSSAETATSQPAEPEAFTVEAYTPAKTMWATSVVNCRSGASTSYAKVGSLTANEEVSVSGVASTGWYEITKEDGTKVYVSNKYLTDVNPNAGVETTEEIIPETTETVSEEVTAEETVVAEAVEEPFTLEETIEEPESIVESESIEDSETESASEVAKMQSEELDTQYRNVRITISIIMGITLLAGTIFIVVKKRKK